jgi:hypothetical protein
MVWRLIVDEDLERLDADGAANEGARRGAAKKARRPGFENKRRVGILAGGFSQVAGITAIVAQVLVGCGVEATPRATDCPRLLTVLTLGAGVSAGDSG